MKAAILVVMITVALGSIASADPVVTATYISLGLAYRLDFTVKVDDSHGSCDGWALLTTAVTDPVAPAGWRVGTGTRETSWDSISSDYNVPPGGALVGSAATFATLPAELDYYVSLIGEGSSPGGHSGTLVPVAVPEPSSILALATGLGAFGLRRRRR